MVKFALLEAQAGATVRIREFEGGPDVAAKLRQYGIFAGDMARIIRFAPLQGPVLLEVNGREIALGRKMASKIIVEAA